MESDDITKLQDNLDLLMEKDIVQMFEKQEFKAKLTNIMIVGKLHEVHGFIDIQSAKRALTSLRKKEILTMISINEADAEHRLLLAENQKVSRDLRIPSRPMVFYRLSDSFYKSKMQPQKRRIGRPASTLSREEKQEKKREYQRTYTRKRAEKLKQAEAILAGNIPSPSKSAEIIHELKTVEIDLKQDKHDDFKVKLQAAKDLGMKCRILTDGTFEFYS